MRKLVIRPESWPLDGTFAISNFSCTTAEVVVVEIHEDGLVGRGEAERTDAYEPDYPDVAAEIREARSAIEAGTNREELLSIMRSGSARNAIDCALWDLEAKRAGERAWRLAGLAPPAPCQTAYTIGLGTPREMGQAAAKAAHRPILKLKLGGEGDRDRVRAVREAAPNSRLWADANGSWSAELLPRLLPELAALGVELIEQPLPVGADEALAGTIRPIPIVADESCLDRTSLDAVIGRYDIINIKLDKTGGLTEALRLIVAGREAGLGLMLGCNLCTSLAVAPAMLIAGQARFVDLDGPLLLARDRSPGLLFEDSLIHPPEARLWG